MLWCIHQQAARPPTSPVLFYKPFRAVGKVEKLLHRWLGPYVVVTELSEVNYEIRLASGEKKSSEIAHVERLKKFHGSLDEIRIPATAADMIATSSSLHLYSRVKTQAWASQEGASG
jgi:hypothetical protein